MMLEQLKQLTYQSLASIGFDYGKQLLTKTVVFCTVLILFLLNCTF